MSSPPARDAAFEKALQQVTTLVKNFQQGRPEDYSEAQARTDFVDKFWTALGWDVNHERQTNPYEQEVRIERTVAVSGRARRADYAFLAPNFRDVRFFVEAKRPGTDLDNPDDCFQVVRYGWNSHVPMSVLTDFQNFRVLDCRYKPEIESATYRVIPELRFHCTEYTNPEVFAKIYYLFARDEVAGGSLERYAETLPKAKGKATQRGLFPSGRQQDIDELFLEELDQFRESLAKSFKKHNPKLGGEELTEATQRTLDRLVFMRFLEDKLIEPEALVENFGNRSGVWQDFVTTSRRLDGTYNGIIFKKHSVLDSASFKVDEEVFEGIREKLAHTNSPYAFHYIPIHILGSIYERFLGKTIIATEKQARVEEKPEVRKAGGVYYTPEYIVRYIVDNTVGKQIADKTPEQIAEMRFADIACGSGSFLLGIFDVLLRRHAAYYNFNKKNLALGRKAGCVEGEDGKLHLTLRQKREILVNNVYGVDLDQQAVEVAQLSLYLKLLEEETPGSVRHYQLEFEEKLLPDLKSNVIFGNSLIGWNILDGKLFDTDEEKKLKPMDFGTVFPDIMRKGGFDAVVGNPPWLMAGYYLDGAMEYLRKWYSSATGKFDLYYLFLEKAVGLLKNTGALGMIVPNKFFHTKAAAALRRKLTKEQLLNSLVDFGDEQIFTGATNYSCIVVLRKNSASQVNIKKALSGLSVLSEYTIPSSMFSDEPWQLENSELRQLFSKMRSRGAPLKEITQRFGTGVQTGADRILTVSKDEASALALESDALTPIYRGRDVRAYSTACETRLLILPYAIRKDKFEILTESELRKSSAVYSLLSKNKTPLAKRIWFGKSATELSGHWYGMMYLDAYAAFKAPHILTPSLSNRSNFALGTGTLFATGTAGVTSIIPRPEIKESISYLLGVLNSKLLSFYAINHSPVFSGGYYKFSAPYLKELPIRRIQFSQRNEVAVHNRIAALVEQMMDSKNNLFEAESDRDRQHYEHKCAALDRQIDQLVYELYELGPEEVALVDGSTPTIQ